MATIPGTSGEETADSGRLQLAPRRPSGRCSGLTVILAGSALAALFAGCRPDALQYREFKRVHEKVTQAELEQYLRVVKSLPGGKVPELPIYRPLPDWDPERTLPVNELLNEERKLLDRGWNVEWLSRELKGNRLLQRALRRENLTTEQFVGLTLAVGAALSRSRLNDDRRLDAVIKRAKETIRELERDDRTFAKLSREARYSVLRKAAWLTRMDRASRLKDVPPENLALVAAHEQELKAVFGPEFQIDPLESIADLLEERGMPFEELEASGRDEEITWSRDNADVGTDKPDAPAREATSAER